MRLLAIPFVLLALYTAGCNRADDAAAERSKAADAAQTAGVNYPLGMMLAEPALGAEAGGQPVSGNYEIDTAHAGAVFAISHLGLSYTYGRFNELAGTYTIDAEDAGKSSFSLVIQTASVDTANAKRDEHLRNADFFNAGNFPQITFQSTKVEKQGDVYQVTGDLSLHGVTNSVTFPLRMLGQQDNKNGFATQFSIMRSEYGMDYGLENVGDEVAVMISFEGEKK